MVCTCSKPHQLLPFWVKLFRKPNSIPKPFMTILSTKKREPHFCNSLISSGVTGNRTRDTRIFSPLLYQLSYDTIFCKNFPLFRFGIAKIGKIPHTPNFFTSFLKKLIIGPYNCPGRCSCEEAAGALHISWKAFHRIRGTTADNYR